MHKLLLLSLFVLMLFPSDAEARRPIHKTKEELELMESRRIAAMVYNLDNKNYIPLEQAIRSFEVMGFEAVPHLIAVLRDKEHNTTTHINAIYTLGRIGSQAKKAIPVIVSFLRAGDENAKAVSAIALGKIGRNAKDAVPYLVPLLFDTDKWVAKSTRTALLRIGGAEAKLAVQKFDQLRKKIQQAKQREQSVLKGTSKKRFISP